MTLALSRVHTMREGPCSTAPQCLPCTPIEALRMKAGCNKRVNFTTTKHGAAPGCPWTSNCIVFCSSRTSHDHQAWGRAWMPMDFRCMVFCSSRTRPDAASSALDGTQPRLTHVPPMSCPSMMATFKPWSAARHAIAAAQFCQAVQHPLPSRTLTCTSVLLCQSSSHTV